MEEKRKKITKKRLAIIIGIIIVILLVLGLFRCSDDGSGNGILSETQGETAKEDEEEIELPKNPSIGETVTGEEIQEKDGLTVSDKDMDEEQPNLSSGDKIIESSSDKSNSNSENKSEDKKDDDSEEEKQPEDDKTPVGEEDSGESSEEDTTNSKKYEKFY